MKILIIGAVAAGTSAAAKARRNNEDAEITIYEKDSFISYSGCGMPYYIGGHVGRLEELVPRNPAFFKSKYNVNIFTRHEVLSIDPDKKTLVVKNLTSGEIFIDNYDKLILATGAKSVIPPIKGVEHSNVFTLRNIVDMNKIAAFIKDNTPTKDPVMYTGMILDNAISRGRPVVTAKELDAIMHSGEKYNLVDARTSSQYEKSHIQTAVNIPHENLRSNVDTMDKDAITITYCNKGVTGNAAQNIFINRGFKKVYNVSGGHKNYSKTIKQ